MSHLRKRPAVHHPEKPVHRDTPAHQVAPRPAPPAITAAPPPRRRVKTTAPTETLGEQWGKLTHDRGTWAVRGLRAIAFLIAFALVGVVIAPPALSAHDIIGWAQSRSVESGLGLSQGWAIVAFLALDFAAGVCVLICLFCALVNEPAGKFALYVWAFALATAYANHSFGTRPGAPGDAGWFFPAMSLLGPLLLHSVLNFLRKRIAGAQGNKRGKRPTFPLVDWLPVVGTPQDTFGAWRTGAMLSIEVPDAALWAYRAVSLDAGWVTRWFVRKLVRAHQTSELRTMLENPDLALAIPGLVPSAAFVSLVQPDPAPQGNDPASQAAAPAGRTTRPVQPGAPVSAPVHDAPEPPTGAPVVHQPVNDHHQGAPVHQGAPGAPVHHPSAGNVVSLDDAARVSAIGALSAVHAHYGKSYSSWAELTAPGAVSLSQIERELGIGKRRMKKAFEHAELVLPWVNAQSAREATA